MDAALKTCLTSVCWVHRAKDSKILEWSEGCQAKGPTVLRRATPTQRIFFHTAEAS